MHCIVANFGDDSIALIQWAYDSGLENVTVLSVDTHWQTETWKTRTDHANKWIHALKFDHQQLIAEHGFAELVLARKHFPSKKFHWCANFLKGLTLLNWLEQADPSGKAIILLPHRRSMSKAQADLPDKIEAAEKFDDRQLRYPLANFNQKMRDALIAKTPFKKPLNHRSLECQPCIYLTQKELPLANQDMEKTATLETTIRQTMFSKDIGQYINNIPKQNNYYDAFATACSWDYGCGL